MIAMIVLKEKIYPALVDAIDQMDMNTLFARSVLTGDAGGLVYSDSDTNPEAFYLVHPYGMTFLFGNHENSLFQTDLKAYFRTIEKDQWLQASSSAWYPFLRELAEQGRAVEYARLNFTFDKERFLTGSHTICPEDYYVVQTPVELIGNLEGTVVPKDFWVAERYSQCIGFTVFVDGEPVSTAYSSYLHGDKLEMGIETVEKHRGKGFAEMACTALIRYCLERGFVPVWSCRGDNTGSVKLAKKLGFTQTKKFLYFHIPA